jgi:hypothetical protein
MYSKAVSFRQPNVRRRDGQLSKRTVAGRWAIRGRSRRRGHRVSLFRCSARLSLAIETFASRATGSGGSPRNSRATNAILR